MATAAAAAGDTAQPKRSVFALALEKAPAARDTEDTILTDGFLNLCDLIIPVIESFGSAFAIVRGDISGNIERLRTRYATDPSKFSKLFSIVDDEVARGDQSHSSSCTKGLLWLKRAMEFMVQILRRLGDSPESTLSEAVNETYYATLYKFHGFFASSAFRVAFAFVPNRGPFLERVAGGSFDEQTAAEMAQFVEVFTGLLAEVHTFLDKRGLDDPCKV